MARSNYQDITIPLSGGRDGDVDPKLLQPPKLLQFKNCRYDRKGEIRKRPPRVAKGQTVEGGGSISANGTQLLKWGDELLLFSGGEVFRWSEDYSEWDKIRDLDTGSFYAVDTPVNSDASFHTQNAAASGINSPGNSLSLVVHDKFGGSSGEMAWSVVDADGTIIKYNQDTLTTTSTAYGFGVCKVIRLSTSWIIVYRSATNDLDVHEVNFTTLTGTDRGTFITDLQDANAPWDICRVGTLFAVAYTNTAPDLYVKYFQLSSTTPLASTSTGDAPDRIGIGYTADDGTATAAFAIVYRLAGTGVRLWTLNSNLTTASGPTTIDSNYATDKVQSISLDVKSSGVIDYYYDTSFLAWPTRTGVFHGTANNAGNVSGPTEIAHGFLFSKPTVRNGTSIVGILMLDEEVYEGLLASASDMSSNFATTAIIIDSSGNVQAQFSPGQGPYYSGFADATQEYMQLVELNNIAVGSRITIPLMLLSGYQLSGAGGTYENRGRMAYWLPTEQKTPHCEANGVLYFGGDYLLSYDGVHMHEHGFLQQPLTSPEVTAVTSGGNLKDATYSVIVLYEYLNSKGQVIRSLATRPVSATISGGSGSGELSVQYANIRDTGVARDIKVKIFRTDEEGGSIYYLAAIRDNSPSNATSTYALDEDDADVTNKAQPYSASEIQATPPGALYDLVASGDKALAVSALDRKSIWESKPLADRVALEFSDALVTPFPEGGDITKLMFMDGRNIIFKRGSIYYRTGSGANAAGAGGYSAPVQLSSTIGARYRDSVSLTPLGIVFQSDHGIYLLSRDLQVQPIGDPVADLVDGQEVVRAVSHPSRQEIHFLLDDSDGTVLVWDYGENAWGQDDTPGASKLVDIIAVDGSMHYLLADGTVEYEDDTAATWTDDSGDYSTSFKTPWINLDGLNGYQRVRRFGLIGQIDAADSTTNHIQVKVYTNYDEDTAVETHNFDYETAGPLQLRRRLANQRCSAIMFEVIENDQGGTQKGTRFSGVSLEIKRKGGTRRLPAAQS